MKNNKLKTILFGVALLGAGVYYVFFSKTAKQKKKLKEIQEKINTTTNEDEKLALQIELSKLQLEYGLTTDTTISESYQKEADIQKFLKETKEKWENARRFSKEKVLYEKEWIEAQFKYGLISQEVGIAKINKLTEELKKYYSS
tara:strand:- start:1518 stop:1949 length:432 start_codon:yes stop_codon:yes gene_type:complete